MKSNFHSHQIVYVKGIGYARLAIEEQMDIKSKETSQTVQNNDQSEAVQLQNDQSTDTMLFDPDMFNIDADSPFGDSQVQLNLSQLNTRKKSIQVLRRASTQSKNKQLIIMPLKLQQTIAMIYCPQPYLTKKINIYIKSLLHNNRRQIQLNIQITKTIDSFRNQIFKQLGQQIGYYSDIRIFTIAPRLQELNVGSKTIWQCQLKDKCRVTMAAKLNFTFKALTQAKQPHFALSNVNNTISYIPPLQSKQQLALANTDPSSLTTNSTNTQTPKLAEQQVNILEQPKTQQVVKPEAGQQKPQKALQTQTVKPQTQKHKSVTKIQQKEKQKLFLQCNVKLRSGMHYWEIKIDKLQTSKQSNSLLIGVCLKSEQQSNTSNCIRLWGYDPVRCRKVQTQNFQGEMGGKQQPEQNGSEESDEEYGSIAKNGDSIGVFLSIKQKTASLVFYKNYTCLQECYQFSVQKLRSKQLVNCVYICPFVSLSGQVQLTLDSKTNSPLDSYRFK